MKGANQEMNRKSYEGGRETREGEKQFRWVFFKLKERGKVKTSDAMPDLREEPEASSPCPRHLVVIVSHTRRWQEGSAR